MTVATDEGRKEVLERYGRFYGEHHFAVAFTEAIQGDPQAKRVTTPKWQFTRPLADGGTGAAIVGNRGLKRNPAIVLRASGLIGLECDGEEDLLAIEQLELPLTLTVRSSQPYKRHFYYRPPADIEQLPYVAFRFESGRVTGDEGRYFVAPPAIHPTGAVYAFLAGHGPDEVDIAEMPVETYRQLATQAGESDATTRRELHINPNAKVPVGLRREAVFKFACAQRRWTADKNEILQMARVWAAGHCSVPLDDEQIEAQVDGAMKYPGEQDLARVVNATPLGDEPEPEAEPPPEDLYVDEDVRPVVPAHPEGWEPIDLADPRYAIPPSPPELLDLIYGGKRHVLSGPPESAKTLIAYIMLIEALRGGRPVAVIDFEMGAEAARRLLEDLGATLDEIRSIYFVAPDTAPPDGLAAIIQRKTWLTLIDAAIGAYDASGLDDNARKDVQRFARTWIDPLWKAGVASLLVDHVTKDKETRGKFTIGSERKLGATDIHISLEAVKTISRGDSGVVKAHVHKDRAGYLTRPIAGVFELASDPQSHRITWRHIPQQHSQGDEPWRPTILMERVSHYLEQQTEPVSFNHVITNTKGKDATLKEALEHLITLGFVEESAGKQGARNVVLKTSYRQPLPTSAQHLPADVCLPLPTSAPPLTGADGSEGGRGRPNLCPIRRPRNAGATRHLRQHGKGRR